MLTNSLPFFNTAPSPWAEGPNPNAAFAAPLMITNHFAPDIAMGQDFDWSWMENKYEVSQWPSEYL